MVSGLAKTASSLRENRHAQPGPLVGRVRLTSPSDVQRQALMWIGSLMGRCCLLMVLFHIMHRYHILACFIMFRTQFEMLPEMHHERHGMAWSYASNMFTAPLRRYCPSCPMTTFKARWSPKAHRSCPCCTPKLLLPRTDWCSHDEWCLQYLTVAYL